MILALPVESVWSASETTLVYQCLIFTRCYAHREGVLRVPAVFIDPERSHRRPRPYSFTPIASKPLLFNPRQDPTEKAFDAYHLLSTKFSSTFSSRRHR